MLDLFHIAKPQNCDIQMFFGGGRTSQEFRNFRTWTKPRGVSHIYIMLIGCGGLGSATNGGGSGAVTVWYGAAQHVPDSLVVAVPGPDTAETNTKVFYKITSASSAILLLSANAANGSTGGAATTSNAFAASGFYSSTNGANGSTGTVNPSGSTFLSAGPGTAGSTINANYGYQGNLVGAGNPGYFQLQPIIVGVSSASARSVSIGCGTGINGNFTGPGFALIASW
jgi:hypothetical protein